MKKQPPLHWQALEYEHRERTPDWFWAVGIITIALSVTAIILHNVLFAFVIVLAGFVLSLYAARPPKEIDVVIDDNGIRVDNVFYPFHSLESFWIDEREFDSKVLIKSQRLMMPYIIVPMGDVDGEKVEAYLTRHIPVVFHSESSFHIIMERLGF